MHKLLLDGWKYEAGGVGCGHKGLGHGVPGHDTLAHEADHLLQVGEVAKCQLSSSRGNRGLEKLAIFQIDDYSFWTIGLDMSSPLP